MIGLARTPISWGLLCLMVPELAGAAISCKYREVKGQGYHGPSVWKAAETYDEAKKVCDKEEECTGFHFYPTAGHHCLYKIGAELIVDPLVADFTAWKKRDSTCEDDGAAADDDDPLAGLEDEDEGEGGDE